MRRPRFAPVVFVAAVVAALAVACDEDLLDDATFHAWCGDALCAWTVEAGSVRKAPTWHPKDYGVELVDTPTVISQHVKAGTTGLDQTPAKCIEFTTVADVDPSAQVTIGMDFDDDGTIDDEQPIAATGFHVAATHVTAPPAYDGLRIVIAKKGVGRAVLAEIRAVAKDGQDACTAPPVEVAGVPLGVPCTRDSECRSNVCCEGTCGECCGKVVSQSPLPGGGSLVTSDGVCTNGAKCTATKDANGVQDRRFQCGGGAHDRPPGADCYGGSDCASGSCDGASAKAIGGDVFGPDAGIHDCPNAAYPDPGGADCIFVSVRGGRCR